MAVTGLLMMGQGAHGGEVVASMRGNGDSQFGHVAGSGAAPTIKLGPASGAGGTASVAPNSTDLAGQIVLTTGPEPVTGELATLTFHRAYTNAPFPQISAAGARASRAITSIHVTATSAGMALVADTNLPASTKLVFNYQNLGQ